MSKPSTPVSQRFWQKVNKTQTCWLWTGSTTDGYGKIQGHGHLLRAHRWSYEQFVGPVPEGMVLDHLCRTPACVKPGHLEAVTDRVNTLRGVSGPAVNAAKTECHMGHPFTFENTYIDRIGKRACRKCGAIRAAGYRAAKRAALAAEDAP